MSANKTTRTCKQPPYAPDASFVAKCLFRLVRPITVGMFREQTFGLLRGVLLKVMADKQGRSGQVELLSGNLRLLQGFEFNRANTIVQPFVKKCRSYFDETKTQGILLLPSLNPVKDILAPPDARYYQLVAFMIALDYKTGNYQFWLHDQMGFHDINHRLNASNGWQTRKKLEGEVLLVTGIGIKFFNKTLEGLSAKHNSLVIHKALRW